MNLLAVLPVKNLDESKSRLSTVLTREERMRFALELLRRTIRMLKLSEYVKDIVLISRDRRIRSVSKAESVLFLKEKERGLNQALERASHWSLHHGYSANLILPLDLPLLAKEDIDSIVAIGTKGEKMVVIAPDHDRRGTNALLVKPPTVLQYQFGGQSFIRHLEQARVGHIPFQIYISHRIEFDIDNPSQFSRTYGHYSYWLH
jgi:2-phospho-L-lactate guanylyltransferase